MSYTDDRVKAGGEQLEGKVKEGAGKLLGDKEMEYEGKAKKAEGQAHDEAAKTGARAEGALNQAKGWVKEQAGALTGNEAKEAEGEAQKWAGKAERKANT